MIRLAVVLAGIAVSISGVEVGGTALELGVPILGGGSTMTGLAPPDRPRSTDSPVSARWLAGKEASAPPAVPRDADKRT